ncbi:hypothetical protein TSUD_116640 [Trifolium subterraneum]|nr:hypothetical protein TSUD_116640 [Trifolium subterraneum]
MVEERFGAMDLGLHKESGYANGVGNSSYYSENNNDGFSVVGMDEGWTENLSDGEGTVDQSVGGPRLKPLVSNKSTTDKVVGSVAAEEREHESTKAEEEGGFCGESRVRAVLNLWREEER